MAITEESRYQLHQRLEEVLGREQATTLMEHLPPVGWADVATKRDVEREVALCRSDLQREISDLRGEFKAETANVRGDLKEVKGLIDQRAAELRKEMADMGSELRQFVWRAEGALGIVLTIVMVLTR